MAFDDKNYGYAMDAGWFRLNEKVIVVNADELKMLQDYRKEREQIAITEENEKSSNQKAVEALQKIEHYLIINGIGFDENTAENIIKCCEHRLKLINEQRMTIEKVRSILDEE